MAKIEVTTFTTANVPRVLRGRGHWKAVVLLGFTDQCQGISSVGWGWDADAGLTRRQSVIAQNHKESIAPAHLDPFVCCIGLVMAAESAARKKHN